MKNFPRKDIPVEDYNLEEMNDAQILKFLRDTAFRIEASVERLETLASEREDDAEQDPGRTGS